MKKRGKQFTVSRCKNIYLHIDKTNAEKLRDSIYRAIRCTVSVAIWLPHPPRYTVTRGFDV
jgi:hypothetical protein